MRNLKEKIPLLALLIWVSMGCKTVGNKSKLKDQGFVGSSALQDNEVKIIKTEFGFAIASNHAGYELTNCQLLDESENSIQDTKLQFNLKSSNSKAQTFYTLVPNLQRVYVLNATSMKCKKVFPNDEISSVSLKISDNARAESVQKLNASLKGQVSKAKGRFVFTYYSDSLYSFESDGIEQELQYCSVLNGNFDRIVKDIPFNLKALNFVSGLELMQGISAPDLESILAKGTYVKCAPQNFFSSKNKENLLNRFLYFPLYITQNKPHTVKEKNKEFKQPQKVIEEYRKLIPGAYSCFAAFLPYGRESGLCASIFNFTAESEKLTLYLQPFKVEKNNYLKNNGTFLNGGHFLDACRDQTNEFKSFLYKQPVKRVELKSKSKSNLISNERLFVNEAQKVEFKYMNNEAYTIYKDFVRIFLKKESRGDPGRLYMNFKHKDTTGKSNSLFKFSVCTIQ